MKLKKKKLLPRILKTSAMNPCHGMHNQIRKITADVACLRKVDPCVEAYRFPRRGPLSEKGTIAELVSAFNERPTSFLTQQTFIFFSQFKF
jgi:hypothetical protein